MENVLFENGKLKTDKLIFRAKGVKVRVMEIEGDTQLITTDFWDTTVCRPANIFTFANEFSSTPPP